MTASRPDFMVGEDGVVCPAPGQVACAPGVIIGFTRPWNKPWEIAPHRAANEPAKPPLLGGDVNAAIPFTAEQSPPEGES